MLLLLVILPCHTEADHTLGLDKSLEHLNELWPLLDNRFEGLKDLLDGLRRSERSFIGSSQPEIGLEQPAVLSQQTTDLKELLLIRIALDAALAMSSIRLEEKRSAFPLAVSVSNTRAGPGSTSIHCMSQGRMAGQETYSLSR